MPAHASRTLAPAPSAPPGGAARRLPAPARRRPANADTPAELSASPASRPVTLRSVDSGVVTRLEPDNRRHDDALVRGEMRPLLRSGLVLRARPRPSDARTPQRGRFWRARLNLRGSALVKARSRAESASGCQHIGAAMVEPGEQGLTIGQSACGCDPAASEDPTPHSARDEA